jgi:hypothetical protein
MAMQAEVEDPSISMNFLPVPIQQAIWLSRRCQDRPSRRTCRLCETGALTGRDITIILIVLVIILLFGGFGYSRRGR